VRIVLKNIHKITVERNGARNQTFANIPARFSRHYVLYRQVVVNVDACNHGGVSILFSNGIKR
jgi:hypothetical protein